MKRLLVFAILALGIALVPSAKAQTHSITITITPGSGGGSPTSFVVNRGTAAGAEMANYGTVPANGLTAVSFVDTNGVGGTKYFYTVNAVNSAGSSPASVEVAGTFLPLPVVLPATPSVVLTIQ